MALATRGSVGGSLAPFFDPKNFSEYLVLILEPKGNTLRKDVPGNFGPRDQINAVVTSFKTQGSLEKGEPTEVKEYTLNGKSIVNELLKQLETDPAPALIVSLLHYQPKGGGNKTWVLREPRTDEDYDAAVKYYEAREAATTAALADVPDFDAA